MIIVSFAIEILSRQELAIQPQALEIFRKKDTLIPTTVSFQIEFLSV